MKVRITDQKPNQSVVNIYDIVLLLEDEGNSKSNKEISLIKYIEDNKDKFKKNLQDYYYEISKDGVYEKFQIKNNLNYFWVLVNEERNQLVNNPLTTKILKYLAIEDVLSKHNLFSLSLEIEDQTLLNAIKQRYSLHEIEITGHRYFSSNIFSDKLKKTYLVMRGIIWYFNQVLIAYIFFKVKTNFPAKKNSLILVGYFESGNIKNFYNDKVKSKYWGGLTSTIAENNIYSYYLNIWVNNGLFKKYNYRKYIKKINKKSLFQCQYILDSFISINIILKVFILWFKLIYVYNKNQDKLNKNPIHNITKKTRNYSVYGWIGVRNIYIHYLFQEALKIIPNSSNGIYLKEFHSWEYLLNNAWETSGHKKIIGYTHVPLKNWDLRAQQSYEFYKNKKYMNSNYPDYIGVDCLNSINVLVNSGYPESKIVKLESLRYTQVKNKDIVDKKNKVILFIGDYIPQSNINFLRYLDEVDSFLDYQIIIKPHPHCPISLKQKKTIVEISNAPLNLLLAQAEMVICGQSTTACIDVRYANLKLGILYDTKKLNLNLLYADENVFFIKNNNDMKNFINNKKFLLTEDFKFYFLNTDNSYKLWKELLNNISRS